MIFMPQRQSCCCLISKACVWWGLKKLKNKHKWKQSTPIPSSPEVPIIPKSKLTQRCNGLPFGACAMQDQDWKALMNDLKLMQHLEICGVGKLWSSGCGVSYYYSTSCMLRNWVQSWQKKSIKSKTLQTEDGAPSCSRLFFPLWNQVVIFCLWRHCDQSASLTKMLCNSSPKDLL